MQGWGPLYRLSWRLGWRALLRGGPLRQGIVRIVIPLDPSRYMELPETLGELAARPGDEVLDLASPKLAAVALAERGARVTSVDALESEISIWRRLAGERPGLRFMCADGRDLPFGDAAFEHAYSVSVIEHIGGDGDEAALRELARVVRPGGRVVVTVPYAERYHEDWRDSPLYDDEGGEDGGRHFFERHYDRPRLDQLASSAPGLRETGRRVMRMTPNWHRHYVRAFPWLIPLGPFFGLIARLREGPPGDVARVTFVREGAG